MLDCLSKSDLEKLNIITDLVTLTSGLVPIVRTPVQQETWSRKIRGPEKIFSVAVIRAQESYPIRPRKAVDLLIPHEPAYSTPTLCSWLGILRSSSP